MACVEEIGDLDSLQSYRIVWNSLLHSTPGASFFHTFDWLDTYWRHFGHGQQLRVLVVRAADQPIGIVPLCIRTENRRLGKVRVLTYPLDGWGASYGPLGDCQAATLLLAMQHIKQSPRDWDMIDLPWIDHRGLDRGRTARAMNTMGLACTSSEDNVNSYLDLSQGWEAYLASRCSKIRREFRVALRRFGDDHCTENSSESKAEYVRHRPCAHANGDGDPGWDLYDECEQVAENSWQSRSTDGNTLCHPRYRAFLRDAHAAAARRGMLDMNVLRVNGQAVAFNYNYHHDGVVFGLRTGFRRDAPSRSVGATLTMLTIYDAFRRGDRRFELGVGGQEYKQRIQTGTQPITRLTHLPRGSWRSQLVRLGHWAQTVSGKSSKLVAPSQK